MVLRNLIFQTEVVEQRFRTGMVPHHDEQASENGNPERHVQLPCNMLPPYLCLLIAVTFSTPTPVRNTYRAQNLPSDAKKSAQTSGGLLLVAIVDVVYCHSTRHEHVCEATRLSLIVSRRHLDPNSGLLESITAALAASCSQAACTGCPTPTSL